MALKQREKTLTIITIVLLVVVFGRFMVTNWSGPLTARNADKVNLQTRIKKKKEQLAKIRQAQARLADLNRRALPSEPLMAKTVYHNWLHKLTEKAGLDETAVRATKGSIRHGVYREIRFGVQTEGTLDQWVRFLYGFYTSGHLHQIRLVNYRVRGQSIGLNFTIDALSLPGATDEEGGRRAQKLAEDRSEQLALGDLDVYRDAIVQRDLFAPYRPPAPKPVPIQVVEQPKEEPEPPAFDPSPYTYLTSIRRGVDGEPEACLVARPLGKRFELREGDTFELGRLRGRIVHINQDDAEIEIDGERWLLARGNNLREMIRVSGS
ncbi:MAG: hypothetical protein ACYTG0_39820 [Planctomycetota bacterium]|jgi:hypothetical protein